MRFGPTFPSPDLSSPAFSVPRFLRGSRLNLVANRQIYIDTDRPRYMYSSIAMRPNKHANLVIATLLLVYFFIMSKFYVFVLCARVCIV